MRPTLTVERDKLQDFAAGMAQFQVIPRTDLRVGERLPWKFELNQGEAEVVYTRPEGNDKTFVVFKICR